MNIEIRMDCHTNKYPNAVFKYVNEWSSIRIRILIEKMRIIWNNNKNIIIITPMHYPISFK